MTFSSDNINIAIIAAGNWQFATGRFVPGISRTFQDKVYINSQLVTGN